jgi:hypothetical protein
MKLPLMTDIAQQSACSGPEISMSFIDDLPHDAVVARPLKRSAAR